jgi:hypothetical protein
MKTAKASNSPISLQFYPRKTEMKLQKTIFSMDFFISLKQKQNQMFRFRQQPLPWQRPS